MLVGRELAVLAVIGSGPYCLELLLEFFIERRGEPGSDFADRESERGSRCSRRRTDLRPWWRLAIQTLHPWSARGDAPCAEG